jgi:hypothetical protein
MGVSLVRLEVHVSKGRAFARPQARLRRCLEECLNVRLEGQGVTARLSGQMSIEGYLAPTCGEYKACLRSNFPGQP